jgi:hypothetical protein
MIGFCVIHYIIFEENQWSVCEDKPYVFPWLPTQSYMTHYPS